MCQYKRNKRSVDITNLSCDVAVRVEEAEGVVRAAIDCNANFGNVVVSVWCCLCSSKWALVVRVADVELVVVRGVWFQVLCFNLERCQSTECHRLLQPMSYFDCEVYIRAGVDLARIYRTGEVLICGDLVFHANRRV